jgi:threonine dehydrogenase-like Zn-dependent dehydrogenase
LSDEEATPINCGVATMMAASEAATRTMGDAVVVIGLGLLGLYGAAIAKARGARRVIGLDPVASRRARAANFGVDVALDPTTLTAEQIGRQIAVLCPPDGADAVIEVCGDPAVVPAALGWLRTGGTLVLAGLVNPNAQISLDGNCILRRMITLRGVHNYHPRHLLQAVDFVATQRARYPFHSLIDRRYRLDQVGQAISDAIARRAAIVPHAEGNS